MPKLRGHHLICLRFFDGEGYDPGFVENLRAVLKHLRYEDVEIVSGADRICGECPHLTDDICQSHQGADAAIRDMDRKALELLELAVGDSVSWAYIQRLIAGVMREWFLSYCRDCEWLRVCEKNKDFRSARPGDG